jgi:cephalosporin-C deacetylase-like acetyl esterase
MMNSPKFSDFDISEVTYKVVNGQHIQAFILVPKGLAPGKYPIMAKFHGGFFVSCPILVKQVITNRIR